MSIEGMWAIYFGDVDGGQVNSGIAVFETGRIFGGDSLMAYLGGYKVEGDTVRGEARIWAFNPTLEVQTAFGKTGTPEGSQVVFEVTGDVGAGELNGWVAEADNMRMKLPAKLNKVAELP